MTRVDRSIAAAPAAPPRVMVVAAFAAIYLIWGSTYLAIKYAVEGVPPFLMSGVRFFVAGAILYLWSALRDLRAAPNANPAERTVSRAHAWRDAFIVGALLIVGGTGLVAWAELSVPSGMTSLILATTPLWMVLLENVGHGGRAPAPRVFAGVAVGLIGLGILVWPSLASTAGSISLLGVGALTVSALTWSIGALYSRRATVPTSPARATGMQMIAGALLSVLTGLALGEHRGLSLQTLTPVSVLALGYLIVAGALVGFSAYLWLMRMSTPSRVATHAYVNPVVAVLLGWAVAGEPISSRTAIAMAVIVGAVILIVSTPSVAKATTRAPSPLDAARVMRGLRRRVSRAA